MSKSWFIWSGAVLIFMAVASIGGWVLSLPSATTANAPTVPVEEVEAMLLALKPPKRERPLIAVIGINEATETTDYLMPTGVLRRANIADVLMLSTGPGPMQLYPALKVEPDATIVQFDAKHTQGADYVIVPAMEPHDHPAALAWIRSQAERGAIIVSVCAGARVVGAAGLLDGKRATTHWYFLKQLRDENPTIRPVADRRLVVDGVVATTTGITASMPMMLTLIEAIAGRAKAETVAHELGLRRWDARHASNAFRLTRTFATTVLANRMAFWKHDELAIRLEPGMDEVSLALVADAWSRTYRSHATSYAGSTETVVTSNGIRVVPDRTGADLQASQPVSTFPRRTPVDALDNVLVAIAARYGEHTADVVAMQLEYPRQATGRR
ncbi:MULTISPECIES: DJ-1/PfpI family protein [unclassified Chelatococcus]|jgi:putative intracellular protease/amidase|uniref:DJ-1/PfpI family protein n=1 Tax=unclassified Chelatococcus TaxID=2638111 RepID=UPI001BCFF592|nr:MULTISPECIES: DJ-1/PfpI family protein [unclassified Chelatococcus]CAH1655292.1 Transcriptional regulator [Hyphomicrobiales bacterium]MBS7742630.1 DJ-1/PfpI family protein [Chelatococcus sp. HY11]MBX3542252.1 DJ-1/PfpI family protein [Chelatococcus sp.]MCO5075532.1 DJ-1/PfpI family protein [Chelatococcus sp.]CAH1695410.1 Transcriptional regulator [Hyphomicrobiales bacterium]